MASFIENLRNALANRLEKGQSNIVHMNPKNAPNSYSTVRLRENDGDPTICTIGTKLLAVSFS